jgi:hypothetical protein
MRRGGRGKERGKGKGRALLRLGAWGPQGVNPALLLWKTGVCQKVSGVNFTGKLINISINYAYILVFFSDLTVTFHPCSHLEMNVTYKHGFCSCKKFFFSCEIEKNAVYDLLQNFDDLRFPFSFSE